MEHHTDWVNDVVLCCNGKTRKFLSGFLRFKILFGIFFIFFMSFVCAYWDAYGSQRLISGVMVFETKAPTDLEFTNLLDYLTPELLGLLHWSYSRYRCLLLHPAFYVGAGGT